MALSDDLVALSNTGSDIKKANTPQEWRARLDVSDDGGYFISTPRTAGELPDAVEMFKDFDLNPLDWTVISVRKSRWQRYDGEWLEAARVSIKPASILRSETNTDFDTLVAEIKKFKPKVLKTETGELAYVIAVGDTQYGKDAGDGSAGTVRRVMMAIDESVTRLKELQKLGRNIGLIVLLNLGDCIEGSVSQHGKVLGRSDLSVTQQVRLARRILLMWVKALSLFGIRVIIVGVPGNHDQENRITLSDPTDSWQLDIVASVQDICAENPALNHIEFRYPAKDNSTLAIEICGVVIGMAHGHQSRDMGKWWHGQATGRTPVGSADVLLTGHFHHFRADQIGPRLWIQVPAMDGGSAWFRDAKGLESPTGIVSLVVGDGYDPRRDLCVLAGENRSE